MVASEHLEEADEFGVNGDSGRIDTQSRNLTSQTKAGTKRACNECRQQKLRCDVVSDPFVQCSRCRRLSLHCRTDAGFKRVAKRKFKSNRQQTEPRSDHNAATPESRRLSGTEEQSSSRIQIPAIATTRTLPTEPILPVDLELVNNLDNGWPEASRPTQTTTVPDTIGARESNFSSMRQRQSTHAPNFSSHPASQVTARTLDSIELSAEVIHILFQEFFRCYHPYLPFLDPRKSPDQYFHSSRLLFWVIISVASRRYSSDLTLLPSLCTSVPKLLWATLQSVPQNYHDVKAMCILCNWSFPLNSSSLDPTFMLSGTMMHMAMQIGLHRPRNAQDFSKLKVTLTQENLEDRVRTWAACNIVAQSVATGYGQPSTTMYDWALFPRETDNMHNFSKALKQRLRIEMLCDRITKSLYCDMSLIPEEIENPEHTGIIKLLDQQLAQLEAELTMEGISSFNLLYLRCANLHLRLCVLIGSGKPDGVIPSLLALYKACRRLLLTVQSVDSAGGDSAVGENFLMHCPTYIFQMTLAAAFALLKMLRSSFKDYIDVKSGKTLLNSAILLVRKISVTNNDLPGRLADVLAQLWAKDSLAHRDQGKSVSGSDTGSTIWKELQLRARGRMSASVTFDVLLEWRKGFEVDGGREGSPPIRSRLINPVEQFQEQEQEMLSNSSTQETSASAMIPMEWNLDGFPYEDAFYPLNWIVDNTGQPLDMSSQSVENMDI